MRICDEILSNRVRRFSVSVVMKKHYLVPRIVIQHNLPARLPAFVELGLGLGLGL